MDAVSNNQTPPELDSTDRRPSSPSPVHPLAPLEYLQNQRRGSITDPSLHASPPNPAAPNHTLHHTNHNHNHNHQQPLGLSTEQRTKRSPRTIRPTSPFVFGDASVHPPDLTSPNIRRLLRSPSNETLEPSRSPDRSEDSSRTRDIRAPSGLSGPRAPHDESRAWISSDTLRDKRSATPAAMDIGPRMSEDAVDTKARPGAGQVLAGPASAAALSDFDFNMRRHSIAEHPLPHRGMPHPDMSHTLPRSPRIPALPQSLKRKMSPDRTLYSMGEEMEPSQHQTTIPDIEGPAPKRRGSAFDTHRIAQLSLYDRRDSVDSRAPLAPSQQWWMQDRRDSTSSMFSSTSIGSAGYSSSGFSGDSGFPARPGLANIAWPPPHPPGTGHNHEADLPMSGLPRHLQTRTAGPGDSSVPPFPPASVSPVMPPDRRMSVPDASVTSHAQRNLRSKSRPPAPSLPSRTSERQPSTNPSDGEGMAEDSETSPTQGQLLHPPGSLKEGASPYSRSPELRVSHKLAERKRRKEMKDLFDELRDQLPADRGMKASKWEILTKAVDYIHNLKTSQQDMTRELEVLKHELESIRSNQFQQGSGNNHTVTYGSGGVSTGSPFSHPPGLPQQHPSADSTSTT